MIEGEFENAKIIVVDIRPPAGNIDLGTGQQTLRRRDHGDQHIGQYEDRYRLLACQVRRRLFFERFISSLVY